jgi:lipopolysaccharide export system permease protein
MKKIDKLFLKSFLGPFILTTSVVVFIFLLRFLMMYFTDFIGKDLGLDVFAKLFIYFSLITVPTAMPLATLLATLMTFGNLGEHSELTAIKSVGIPLQRMIRSTFLMTVVVAIFTFFYSDKVTPWANLKGYSLLYDVRTTKMTLNIQEGIFYKEIPGYRIKVQKKFPDQKTLKGVTIYDHTASSGNKSVTLADSAVMYTMFNGAYLVFELFNGRNYLESFSGTNYSEAQFTKNAFKKNKMVFSLSSFGIKRTDEEQFKYHEYMKNTAELTAKIDSTLKDVKRSIKDQTINIKNQNTYLFRTSNKEEIKNLAKIKPGPWIQTKVAAGNQAFSLVEVMEYTLGRLQSQKSQVETDYNIYISKMKDAWRADVERWHKITMAFSCLVMFLIGASLGSIIKKGGFGMPVVVSVSFFIFYYVLMQLGDKYAKEGIIPVIVGVWIPNFVLALIALYLASRASHDQSLFDSKTNQNWNKFISFIKSKRQKTSKPAI